MIRQALEEKKRLVADILHVPKEDFENIAELAAEPSKDKEATEIVLAAVSQGRSSLKTILTSKNILTFHNFCI